MAYLPLPPQGTADKHVCYVRCLLAIIYDNYLRSKDVFGGAQDQPMLEIFWSARQKAHPYYAMGINYLIDKHYQHLTPLVNGRRIYSRYDLLPFNVLCNLEW